jgi:LmbE family N-acetylglucosaminyl deacetylase
MGVSRYTLDDVERLATFLLTQPPDVVLTHWQDDSHPDHVATVQLVIEALVRYAVSHGLDDVDASRRVFPQVWSCDTYGAQGRHGGFEPEWYIDVSEVWAQKMHALMAHQSQHPEHWLDLVQRHNAFYGARCHRAYAEGFCRLPLAFVNNTPAYEYLP